MTADVSDRKPTAFDQRNKASIFDLPSRGILILSPEALSELENNRLQPPQLYRRVQERALGRPTTPKTTATEARSYMAEDLPPPPPTPRAGVLEEAKSLIDGDRNNQYGPPAQDFSRTAALWSAQKGVKFEAHEVATFLALLKLSRLSWGPNKRDSWVDLAGYAGCGYECAALHKQEAEARPIAHQQRAATPRLSATERKEYDFQNDLIDTISGALF